MATWLCGLFFLSGASALLFETLWFRCAGLAFGNSVWASSLVLSSFMAGLGLGNALVARHGERLARPVLLYAAAELLIGITGFALILVLPALGGWLAPLARPFLDQPWILNPMRLGIAFASMLAPAVAMGATLPILVAALARSGASFGSSLGMLYGWNTLGAVAGVLAAETLAIPRLGIRGSGLAAAALNLAAALGALALVGLGTRDAASRHAAESDGAGAPAVPSGRRAALLLAAAFLAGALLLALEVVWFRFLLLFVDGSSLAFALMLAVVLAGIGGGGLIASAAARAGLDLSRAPVLLACGGGALCTASYAAFPRALALVTDPHTAVASHVLPLGLVLMLPVSLASGLLFPSLGAALRAVLPTTTSAAGALTFANTIGAALGSLIAGFVLLPRLGMERSLFLLALGYGAVALCAALAAPAPGAPRRVAPLVAGGLLLAVALGLFPFGRMEESYFPLPLRRFATPDETRVVARREGLTETILYTESRRFGESYYHQLLTNGYSMSGDHWGARRYMKLFVYLPVALHPAPRSALLISYGVGSTAKALTDTRELETIDVVDISAEILELSSVVFPDPAEHPLHDPRVRVHVEDGRWFLQTTQQRFDLITGEPPPPKIAGVVNLYTREHFQQLRRRLAPGGLATWWLPVHGLTESDTRAIVAAFCEVFEDCSLWHGTAWNLILMGSRDAAGPAPAERFVRQWQEPRVAAELRALGIERPEQLGALFVGDAEYLAQLARGTPPLTDDFPKRLSDRAPRSDGAAAPALYVSWLDAPAARHRFANSAWVRRSWPEMLRQASLPYFVWQQLVNDAITGPGVPRRATLGDLHAVLTRTDLRTLPLWLLGSDPFEQRAADRALARGMGEEALARPLAARALAERRYPEAARLLALAERVPAADPALELWRSYALCMSGQAEEAWEPIARGAATASATQRGFMWLRRTCDGLAGS